MFPKQVLKIVVMVVLATSNMLFAAGEPAAQEKLLVRLVDVQGQSEQRALNEARRVVVLYRKELNAEKFSASLNGENVTDAFDPGKRGADTVALPFRDGVNTLVIKAAAKGEEEAHSLEWTIDYAPLDASMHSSSGKRTMSRAEYDAFIRDAREAKKNNGGGKKN